MLQNVGKSVEMQDLERKNFEAEIKAYQAETQRLSAVSGAMNPEQVQEVVMQTLRDVMSAGDLVMEQQGMMMPGGMPEGMEPMPEQMEEPQGEMMPPEGMGQ
jgi:hypothetical protein